MPEGDLSERLLKFAVRIGKLADALPETRLGRHVGGNLFEAAHPLHLITKKDARRRAEPILYIN